MAESASTAQALFPEILRCFSALKPHTVVLVYESWFTSNLAPSRWKAIDAALAHLAQSSLVAVQMRLCIRRRPFELLRQRWSSMNELLRALLPQCAFLGLLSTCTRSYAMRCCKEHLGCVGVTMCITSSNTDSLVVIGRSITKNWTRGLGSSSSHHNPGSKTHIADLSWRMIQGCTMSQSEQI